MTLEHIDNETFYYAGDGGLIVDFSVHDADIATGKARRLGQMIRRYSTGCFDEHSLDAANLDAFKGVRDAIPGLNNLLIQFDPLLASSAAIKAAVIILLPQLASPQRASMVEGASRRWIFPVCYGGSYGPDLVEVAQATGLSADEVIDRHIACPLTVAIMGFLPGLAYMKGVDANLHLPRKSTPRQHVEAQSLGIAMDQTVIYPLSSPGGWNLLGRTPVRLFDAGRVEPVLLAPGDEVRFTAITKDEFVRLDRGAAAGEAIVTPEIITPKEGQPKEGRQKRGG
jgi:KipI family sensor histidine kinase inhibitor